MTKTSLDVATEALRHIRVCAVHRAPKAEDYVRARDILDGLLEQLSTQYGMAQPWTNETVPVGVFVPMTRWLGAVIAPAYNRPEYAAQETAARSDVIAYVQGEMGMDTYPAEHEFF